MKSGANWQRMSSKQKTLMAGHAPKHLRTAQAVAVHFLPLGVGIFARRQFGDNLA